MKFLKFKNNEINMAARIVEQGDSYGKNDVLTHKKTEPIVEFFDMRYPHTKLDKDISGQFISRYNISTFNDVKTGLYLDSGSLDWSLNHKSVELVQHWIKETLDNSNILSVDDNSKVKKNKM